MTHIYNWLGSLPDLRALLARPVLPPPPERPSRYARKPLTDDEKAALRVQESGAEIAPTTPPEEISA